MLIQLWLLTLGKIGIFQTDTVQFCFVNGWDMILQMNNCSSHWSLFGGNTIYFWRKHYSISETEIFTFVFNLHWIKGIILKVNVSWSGSHCLDWNNDLDYCQNVYGVRAPPHSCDDTVLMVTHTTLQRGVVAFYLTQNKRNILVQSKKTSNSELLWLCLFSGGTWTSHEHQRYSSGKETHTHLLPHTETLIWNSWDHLGEVLINLSSNQAWTASVLNFFQCRRV